MKTSNNNDLNSARKSSVYEDFPTQLSSCVKATALPVCCDRLRKAGGGGQTSRWTNLLNKSFYCADPWSQWFSTLKGTCFSHRRFLHLKPGESIHCLHVSVSGLLNVAGCLLRRNNTRHNPLGRNAPCCYWLLYSCCFAPEVTRQRSHGIENLT